MTVYRVFVEKKKGFDVQSRQLQADLIANLGLPGLRSVRIFNRYDVSDLSPSDFDISCAQVFSEPPVDQVYIDKLPDLQGLQFGVQYLAGQYDQRADSAAQCIQLLTHKQKPLVRSAKFYAFEGISQADLLRIEQYIINPVDSELASQEKPQSLQDVQAQVQDVAVLDGFLALSADGIAALHKKLGLAMSLADLTFCQAHFQGEGRDPFITEIRVIDTYWSDHCRHTTFLTHLQDVRPLQEENPAATALNEALSQYLQTRTALYGEQTDRPVTLMDMGTIATKALKQQGLLQDLDQSEEINACSIVVPVKIAGEQGVQTQDYLVMFKNETHNHPTEIEPFGGAATCLGGAIRDPLSGRSYVYQAMRVTGSGDVREKTEDTLPGKLAQRKISTGAAAGYSSYGNQIGLATGKVHEVYHPGYKAKRMEIGAVIGAAPKSNVVREVPAAGDIILLIGGRTGRDGIGGATGSSKAHDATSTLTCGAEVQKGNALTERKLQRLFRNPDFTHLVKRCNDFGAGGVCVAIGELADGLTINLDNVSKKYMGLDGTELAISESQERMAVVIAPQDEQAVQALCAQENVEVAKVAIVTEQPVLQMTWKDQTIVQLSRAFLDTNGVCQTANAHLYCPELQDSPLSVNPPLTQEAMLQAVAGLDACSQKGLGERFDSTIGAGSVLMPFGGKYQLTPAQAMAALVPVQTGQSQTATLMSFGFDPTLSAWSAYHGAAYAVVDSLAKLVASGAQYDKARLTFQEYFEKPMQDPKRWGKPLSALLGALQAQLAFQTPAIGGKDSMSGTFGDLDVPPTLVSFAVCALDAADVLSNELQAGGHDVVWLRAPQTPSQAPNYAALREVFTQAHSLIQSGAVLSASAVYTPFVTIAHACLGNGIGFAFAQTDALFTPCYGSILLELKQGTALPESAVLLGKTTEQPCIAAGEHSLSLQALQAAFCGTLERIFPTAVAQEGQIAKVQNIQLKKTRISEIKLAKPRALIPVFPGTNCEIDTARAIEQAGGKADVFIIKNLTQEDVRQSTKALVQAIDNAQMLILPGGFSGGDEPDGSGKFIVAMLSNPNVSEAVLRLLNSRDGLALGICNGFQALLKLGLLPNGKIRRQGADSPTLTFNAIGRHVSGIVRTRITSNRSPWLALCEEGEVYNVAVSHGEGRFIANDLQIKRLFENGQVATQYVDFAGTPTMDGAFNPNGSCSAIEGITSDDGRIFGKMGHSERIGTHLYKNVPGTYDQRIFQSGVKYYS